MVFEGADGALGGIAAMDTGRDQLEVNGLVRHEVF